MSLLVQVQKTVTDGKRNFSIDVNFESSQNFLFLYGPSGAGKTLTLKTIAGLLKPNRGRILLGKKIFFDSQNGIHLPTQKRKIGYLSQSYSLFPHLSVRKNLEFSFKQFWRWKLSVSETEKIDEILELFEIQSLSSTYPKYLSGGQKQRVALARALVARPDLLLLDEPFAALNDELKNIMRVELKKIQNRFQIPVLIVSHDRSDVSYFSGELFAMENGVLFKK
ncbi:ATP-binding cassette domain-containing protein [Leptospira sp. WS92.C1]